MQGQLHALAECRDCGLLQRLPLVPEGGWAACTRCAARLMQRRQRSVPLCAASAVAGLLLLALGVLAPFATVSMPAGRFASANLMTGPETLARGGAVELGLVVMLTLLLLPGLRLVAIVAMAVRARRGAFMAPTNLCSHDVAFHLVHGGRVFARCGGGAGAPRSVGAQRFPGEPGPL